MPTPSDACSGPGRGALVPLASDALDLLIRLVREARAGLRKDPVDPQEPIMSVLLVKLRLLRNGMLPRPEQLRPLSVGYSEVGGAPPG